MQQPEAILRNGTKIRTHDLLGDTKGMLIGSGNLSMRKSGYLEVTEERARATDVVFYPTPMGIECVWTNESCPYLKDGTAYPGQRVVTADERDAASDGHNMSLIPWSDVLAWAALAPKA